MRTAVVVMLAVVVAGGCSAEVSKAPVLTIEPASATIVVEGGALVASAPFTALLDGAPPGAGDDVAWSIDDAQLAAIAAGDGTITPTGELGGVATVTAAARGGIAATAQLVVRLHIVDGAANLDAATRTTLESATAGMPRDAASHDPAIAWAYPYDGTVFPRGLAAPTLMWNGGVNGDWYVVHVASQTYDLESFVQLDAAIDETSPISRFRFPSARWAQLTDSSAGPVEVTVARLAAGAATATGVIHHLWTVAPARLPGTIYYWTQKTETGSLAGRIEALDLASGARVDYFGDLRPTGVESCPKCHTPSADGGHMALVMATGTSISTEMESVSYDLATATPEFVGFPSGGAWGSPALSAHGDVLVENFAPIRGLLAIGGTAGAFDARTGTSIGDSGLEAIRPWMPAFAPDDAMLAYVAESTPNCDIGTGQTVDVPKVKACAGDLRAVDWDAAARRAGPQRTLATKGGDPAREVIQYPVVSPDHAAVVYARGSEIGSFSTVDQTVAIAGDLFVVPAAGGAPEVALANLGGDGYPFAAGDRDRHASYDPSYAPVPAGGYAWVVFVSRRTLGNLLVGPAYGGQTTGTKQLWVAAIDLGAPSPGIDPSHPAFWLPGQDFSATDDQVINQRARWTLSPR